MAAWGVDAPRRMANAFGGVRVYKQKTKRRHPGWQIVSRFLCWYIAMLLISLCMSALVSWRVLDVLRENAAKNSVTMAQHLVDKIDVQIADIESYAVTLSTNGQMREFLYTSGVRNGRADVLAINNLQKHLPEWNTGSGMIESVHVYCSNVDGLFFSDGVCLRMNDMYGCVFGRSDMSFEEWRNTYLQKRYFRQLLPEETNIVSNQTQQRFVFVQSILGENNETILGQVFVYIPASGIMQELQPLFDIGVSMVVLLNEDNQQLAVFQAPEKDLLTISSGEPENMQVLVEEGEVLSNTVFSNLYGLKCVVLIPQTAISAQVSGIRNLMNMYIGIIAGIGLAVVFCLAMRSAKPYVRLVGRLKGTETYPTGIQPIDEALEDIFCQRDRLECAVRRQAEQLENALYYRLIHEPLPEGELDALLEFAHNGLCGDRYIGVLMEIAVEADTSRPHIGAVVEEKLSCMKKSIGFYRALSEHRIAILYVLQSEDSLDTGIKLFTELYEYLLEQYGISTSFYMGQEVSELRDVYKSFQQANQIANYTVPDNAECIVTLNQGALKPDQNHRYTASEASELECLLKAGRRDETMRVLERIRKENEGKSVFQTKLLLSALTDTVLRAADDVLQREEDCRRKSELDQCLLNIPDSSMQIGFRRLEQCLELLCESALLRKKSHKQALAQQISEYMRNHFCDESITLQSVSLNFGMNERYLSNFFKEQKGENFQFFLTRLRIEEANRLLAETDLPIQVIAERVGYVNMNTFRSAYKKIMGYNPSQYERRK